MASLVEELQSAAQDPNVPVVDLLRKAKILAFKLDVPELLQWVENELSGYSKGTELPEYRLISGRVEGFHPQCGWRPVIFENETARSIVSEPRKIGASIAEVETEVDEPD